MDETVNKFLLAGDKFMSEMHLTQTGFTYSACGPFTKNKERIQKFKETSDNKYIYRNELDKACFQHDRPCGNFMHTKGGGVAMLQNEQLAEELHKAKSLFFI